MPWESEQNVAYVTIKASADLIRQLHTSVNLTDYKILDVVHFPYFIISISFYILLIVNEELRTASVEHSPTPTSAYLIAIKSLAPSPTIPTLPLHYLVHLSHHLKFAYSFSSLFLIIFTIFALFYGRIRLNIFICSYILNYGSFTKSLSTQIAVFEFKIYYNEYFLLMIVLLFI